MAGFKYLIKKFGQWWVGSIRKYFLSKEQIWSELLFRRPWSLMRPQKGRQMRGDGIVQVRRHSHWFFLWWPRNLSGLKWTGTSAQDEVCSKKYLSTVVGFSSFYSLILSSLGISALPPVTASWVPLPGLFLLPSSFLPPIFISFIRNLHVNCIGWNVCLFICFHSCSLESSRITFLLCTKDLLGHNTTTAFTWLHFHLLNILMPKTNKWTLIHFNMLNLCCQLTILVTLCSDVHNLSRLSHK